MPRKYPSGVFNKDHFGIGGIKVKFLDNDRVRLRYGKRQMTVSEEFYWSRLDVQFGYRDTEDFFNSFYWGTQAGIRERDANYKENFNVAIRSKFEKADTADLQYAVDIWKNMSFAERDKFTNENCPASLAVPKKLGEASRERKSAAGRRTAKNGRIVPDAALL